MTSGMNYKSSPRCAAFSNGFQCRLREDAHVIVNGYNQHKWWGCGECSAEKHEWLDMAYLTNDDYAERAIRRLKREFEQMRDRRESSDWAEAVAWCENLLRTADLMEEVA